jgi:excisionase family DNA binding protein
MVVVDGVEMVEVAEAARLANRTPETIRRWVWSGRLPARKEGNRLLIARSAVITAASGRDRAQAAPRTLSDWRDLVSRARAQGALGAQRPAQSAADLVLEDRSAREPA